MPPSTRSNRRVYRQSLQTSSASNASLGTAEPAMAASLTAPENIPAGGATMNTPIGNSIPPNGCGRTR